MDVGFSGHTPTDPFPAFSAPFHEPLRVRVASSATCSIAERLQAREHLLSIPAVNKLLTPRFQDIDSWQIGIWRLLLV